MMHVNYECDICHSTFKSENAVVRMPTSSSIHVCNECFERWEKSIDYCLQYIHELNLRK